MRLEKGRQPFDFLSIAWPMTCQSDGCSNGRSSLEAAVAVAPGRRTAPGRVRPTTSGTHRSNVRAVSARTRPQAVGRGRHPIRISKVPSAHARWPVFGEQITGGIASTRPSTDVGPRLHGAFKCRLRIRHRSFVCRTCQSRLPIRLHGTDILATASPCSREGIIVEDLHAPSPRSCG
jgi:hypothetical protein